MPILPGAVVAPPEPPPAPRFEPPPPAWGTTEIRWVPPRTVAGLDTREWVLTDWSRGFLSLPGRDGFGKTPTSHVTLAMLQGGALLQSIHREPRILSIPLQVNGGHMTQDDFLDLLGDFSASFNHPNLMPGRLYVRRGGRPAKYVEAYYQDGLDAAEGKSMTERVFDPLRLVAYDPDWRSDRTIQVEFSLATTPGLGVLADLPNIELGSENVNGSPVVVDVAGDMPTAPTFRLEGPLTRVTATHEDLGQVWDFAYPLQPGDGVTITANPESALLDSGLSVFGRLKAGSAIWSLMPGPQTITVEVVGADSTTRVSFTYEPRSDYA